MAFDALSLLIYPVVVVAKEHIEHLTKRYTGVGSPNVGISRYIAAGRYSSIRRSVPHIKHALHAADENASHCESPGVYVNSWRSLVLWRRMLRPHLKAGAKKAQPHESYMYKLQTH
jgi:hypothetical protein